MSGAATRRFEVINGVGGRRHWSMDDEARIVRGDAGAERNHFRSGPPLWSRAAAGVRLAARSAQTGCSVQQESPAFGVDGGPLEPVPKRPAQPRKRRRPATLEIDGMAMRVGRGGDSKTVAAVIRALKATS